MDVSKKGIALILFAILIALGAAAGFPLLWVIALPIGIAGLIIVLTDKSGKNS